MQKDCLYKLIDEESYKYAANGLITLSRPVFEFKGSEGKIIEIIKNIYDRYKKKGLEIKPSLQELNNIRNWIAAYIGNNEISETFDDITTEIQIMLCQLMQHYCGYYTRDDLFNKNNLIAYTDKNPGLKNKTYVMRIKKTVFMNDWWEAVNPSMSYFVSSEKGDKISGLNGHLRLVDITYTDKYDDLVWLLSNFNETRDFTTWFRYLSAKFIEQNEVRILFNLKSLNYNESRTGCDHVYFVEPVENYYKETIVYCNIIDSLYYCQSHQRYIYLNIGNNNISLAPISDIYYG